MNGTTGNTLEELLQQLGAGFDKAASESEKQDDKDEKAEKKDEDDKKGKMPPWLKDKDEKKDDKGEEGQTKEAALAGAALAREVAEQAAAAALNTNQTTGMNKQASLAGKALAEAVLATLTKQAGESNTADGIAPEGVPAMHQRDNAQMVAEQAAAVKPMPTSDGLRPTGTINQIFDAVVQDALSQGAASTDQVHETGIAAQEGAVEDHATPNQMKVAAMGQLLEQGFSFDEAAEMVKQASEQGAQASDEMEKAAAVQELVTNYGIDFGDAVEMIKAAAEEIEREEDTLMKAAAMDELLAQGLDFDTALTLIKQAGESNTADGIAPEGVPAMHQRDNAQMVAEQAATVKPMPTSDGLRPTGTINEIFDAIIQDALSQGAASTDQVHTVGVAAQEGAVEDHAVPNQAPVIGDVEKTAAMTSFLQAGFDFDQAAGMVKQAGDLATAYFKGPGYMEADIRKQYTGEETPTWDKIKGNFRGNARAGGRGILEGLAGGAIGTGLGVGASYLSKGKISPNVGVLGGGTLGILSGNIHGHHASIKNQAQEAHEKYRAQEKQASVASSVKGFVGKHMNTAKLNVDAIRNGSGVIRTEAAKELARNPLVLGGAAAAGAAGAGAAYAGREKQAAAGQLLIGKGGMSLKKKLALGAAGVAGAGAAGYGAHKALAQEKQAAVNSLVELGMDFDTAVAAVNQKAGEIYGK